MANWNCLRFETAQGPKFRKLNAKAANHSFRYSRENVRGEEKIVIRDYFSGEVLQTMKVPQYATYVNIDWQEKYDK